MNRKLTFGAAFASVLCFPFLAFACGDYSAYGNGPCPACGETEAPAKAPSTQSRDVDLVIALDTSGSMEGLIDDCRRKLWDMCSLLAQARPTPKLRVSLVTFGGNENPDGGYVVVRSNFTEELDEVYEQLMALTTDGGTELVGRALHESLTKLQWSGDSDALRLIFVAGNESADQDSQFDFRKQVRDALQRNIVVHAIYCGADSVAGDPAGWREIAQISGGQYASIDQNGTINIETPFDAKITQLGVDLNATYLPFGMQGKQRFERQSAQDGNAAGYGSSTSASRAQLKANSKLYCNSSWDLVDATCEADFDWSKVKEEHLPEALRGKTQAEIKGVVEELRAKRKQIQEQIKTLSVKREAFVKKELESHAAERSLDFVLAKALKEQAEKRGFSFK